MDSKALCECGHPVDAHGPQEWPKDRKDCRANVHVAPRMGDAYSYPCPCRKFTEDN